VGGGGGGIGMGRRIAEDKENYYILCFILA